MCKSNVSYIVIKHCKNSFNKHTTGIFLYLFFIGDLHLIMSKLQKLVEKKCSSRNSKNLKGIGKKFKQTLKISLT